MIAYPERPILSMFFTGCKDGTTHPEQHFLSNHDVVILIEIR